MTKQHNKFSLNIWMLSFLSFCLLSIPFKLPHLGLVALIGFVPLLSAEHLATEKGYKRFFIIYYLGFFVWNIINTYWLLFATPPGAVTAFVLNSLQMAIIFALY